MLKQPLSPRTPWTAAGPNPHLSESWVDPVFSWPWFFRSSLLFNAFGAGLSLLAGITLGLSTGQWAQGGLVLANYLFIGGGLTLRSYFNERRQWVRNRQRRELEEVRRARQQAELRLAVLQAQVEPHFLFNTLASVRSLVRQDPARAEATIDALVDYLRAAIPKLRASDRGAASTLGEQFALCESYLKLMKVRMGSRLSYGIALPETLVRVPFPPLMLISLVENAVKHGLEPKLGSGRIELRALEQEPGLVRVVVSDDGMGLQPGLGSGVGLANIREQLLTLYGEHASLSLQGGAAGGVTATLCLPGRVPA